MFIVKDIMSSGVYEIPDNKLVCEIGAIFISENISGAPLVNESGVVVGLISKTDIIHFDSIGGDAYITPATEIATPTIVYVKSSDSVVLAAQTMIKKEVHRLLVVDDGKMVGMLSETDIVKLVANSGITKPKV